MVRKPFTASDADDLALRCLDLAAELRETANKMRKNDIESMDVHSRLMFLGLDHSENAMLGITRDLVSTIQKKTLKDRRKLRGSKK